MTKFKPLIDQMLWIYLELEMQRDREGETSPVNFTV